METETEMLRLFVAVSVPDRIKAELALAQEELRSLVSEHGIRWTRTEQFHLTLKFLGNVPQSDLSRVSELLHDACTGFPVLRLRCERIGFFPHKRVPRVIWASVHDEAKALPMLQESVEAALEGICPAEKENDFTAHVTLARCHDVRRSDAETLLHAAQEMNARFFGEWEVKQVELIRSELRPGGSRYSLIDSFPLARGTAFDTLPPQ